ncbi:MAG TPA: alpha/beta hydrolase [Steroidobacteraceae bacterium]|nr:alpha/beta hydrolase [Steroidobacteraceae bacterium]
MSRQSGLTRRELILAGGAAAALGSMVPLPASSATALRHAPPLDPLALVDPGVRPPLEAMIKSNGVFVVNEKTLQQARKPWPNLPAPQPAPPYEERKIPGAMGAPDVRVYLINAGAKDRPRPAILHMHGGGYVLGTAATSIPALQQLAKEQDCVIATVDYRLAPETPFPGSLEDNWAALKWLYGSAASLGVDPSKIAVMGESAGGGHAAMLAIAARDRGEVPVAFQLLIYPMLDDRTGSSRRVPPYLGAYIWLPESNRFGWSSLLGVTAGSRSVPAGAVPARVEDLAGLPPAFIGVGSVDLFVDEDIDFARRLIDSGVPTELCVVPGGYHGFDVIAPGAPASKAFRASWSAALAKAFAAPA